MIQYNQGNFGKSCLNGGTAMNVKNKLLDALANAGNEYISGAALAAQLGVSRNAVWKAVKALSEIDSTNSRAKELASEGAVHGTTVVADMQSAGRGRLGRAFVSPSGKGLYMSVIIRPDYPTETASLITSATACAAAEAVENLCGSEVRIKWVNDLYMHGKKICGILTEASLGLEMRTLDYAVIGIGVNVRKIGESFDSDLSMRATSIEDVTDLKLNRNELCAEILNCLEKYLDSLEERGFLAEYRRRELLTGNLITANIGGETITAKAVGIDDNANLIAELPDGSTRHLGSGEANLCRIKT